MLVPDGILLALRNGSNVVGLIGIDKASGKVILDPDLVGLLMSSPVAASSPGVLDIGAAAVGIKRLFADFTNTAPGTTGNQTINKMSGRVNIAALGTTVTVTNNLVTAASQVFAVCATNDVTAAVKSVVPGAGSFVITLTAAATAEVAIAFFVLNTN